MRRPARSSRPLCHHGPGAKRLTVGEDTFDYDARHYLISSVDLPIFSRITCASIGEPYLGLALNIDRVKINELAAEMSKIGLWMPSTVALASVW